MTDERACLPNYPDTGELIMIGHEVEVNDGESSPSWFGRVVGIRLPIGGEGGAGWDAVVEIHDTRRRSRLDRPHYSPERIRRRSLCPSTWSDEETRSEARCDLLPGHPGDHQADWGGGAKLTWGDNRQCEQTWTAQVVDGVRQFRCLEPTGHAGPHRHGTHYYPEPDRCPTVTTPDEAGGWQRCVEPVCHGGEHTFGARQFQADEVESERCPDYKASRGFAGPDVQHWVCDRPTGHDGDHRDPKLGFWAHDS